MPISERDLHPYIKALVEEYGELTVTELDQLLREVLTLDADDLTILTGRRDDKFSQTVRNVVSHTTNVITKKNGYIIDKSDKPAKFYALSPTNFNKPNVSDRKVTPAEITTRSTRKRSFNARKVDFHALNLEKSELGSLGEYFALEWERRRLIDLEVSFQVSEEVIHVSNKYGDGAGYDILSRDENYEPFFIEVKTTTRGLEHPFYMSENEKLFLELNDNVKIYRVYNYNKDENTGEVEIIEKIDFINNYKLDPITYKVSLK